MSASWDATLGDLRTQYLRESRARLEEMAQVIDRLERSPSDATSLRELRRHFHAMVGSGQTYGFPAVSTRARRAEQAAIEWMAGQVGDPGDRIAAWREDLQALREALEAPSEEGSAPESSLAPASAPAWRILMAEPDPALQAAFTRLAAQEGFAVQAVGTEAEAKAALERGLPDGVVTSVRLPGISGYALVEHVRGLPGGDQIPVLMVSPVAAFLDKVEAIHCGADAYFDEPVDWAALMRRLQHRLERARARSARVLMVEDDAAHAAYARAVLESAGYEVRVCAHPQDFESDLLAWEPDLVLMDIVLPAASGYDLVRYVRQDERHATLPVIFLTAERRMEARIEGVRAGGDDHLLKPITPSLLLCSVASRIERARFVRALLERDGLTGLLTHTAFLERARALLSVSSRRAEHSCAWVMIDLDHFKAVNDTHGHPVGDRVLASLAGLLRRRLRQSDVVGRYGGEEFAVLLEDLSEAEAVRLLVRLHDEFAAERHPAPGSAEFHCTFSAGVAVLGPEMDLEAWRVAADRALYAAKAAGRNRVVGASTMSQ